MARAKHAPKSPQIHGPVAAIGKDVWPPRRDIPWVPGGEGRQPGGFLSHGMLRGGIRPTGGVRRPHRC